MNFVSDFECDKVSDDDHRLCFRWCFVNGQSPAFELLRADRKEIKMSTQIPLRPNLKEAYRSSEAQEQKRIRRVCQILRLLCGKALKQMVLGALDAQMS